MSDHYKTLGLSCTASKQEIKDAFRKCALKFHPDRHSQSSKSIKEHSSSKFKQVSEAYEVLIDDRKRAEYDFKSKYSSSGRGGGYASSSHSHSYKSNNYSGNNGGRSDYYYKSASRRSGVNLGIFFHYVTSRGFLLNLTLVGFLLGGAVVIEKSINKIWEINNSGKSFEETIEKSGSQK